MSTIYEKNGFTYTVEDNGTINAQGKVPEQGIHCGKRVTPDGMTPGDQRGHIIAASHGGVNADYNMTAQAGNLNQSAYKTLEQQESQLARQGYDVQTSKTAYVSNQEGGRPDAYMINDQITDPQGNVHTVNLSFQNMSNAEQEALNAELDSMDYYDEYDNPDPLRESMSKEEYTALMEETDSQLPSIKDEFDFTNTSETHFSNDSDEGINIGGNDSGENGVSVSDDGGIDGSTDGGMDTGTDGGTDGGMEL